METRNSLRKLIQRVFVLFTHDQINYLTLHVKNPEIHRNMRSYRLQQNDKLFYPVLAVSIFNMLVKIIQVYKSPSSENNFILMVAVFTLLSCILWALVRCTRFNYVSSFIFNVPYLIGETIMYVLASENKLPDYLASSNGEMLIWWL